MCHSPIPSITMNDSDLHTVDHSKLVRICPPDRLQPCRWSHRPAKSAPNHITHKAPLTCIKCAQIMQPSPSNIVGFKSASLIGKINKNINKEIAAKMSQNPSKPPPRHLYTSPKNPSLKIKQAKKKERQNSTGNPHSDACEVPIYKRNLLRFSDSISVRSAVSWCSYRNRFDLSLRYVRPRFCRWLLFDCLGRCRW